MILSYLADKVLVLARDPVHTKLCLFNRGFCLGNSILRDSVFFLFLNLASKYYNHLISLRCPLPVSLEQ